MTAKYHVHTSNAPSRFIPVARLSAMEIEGCLGCLECVKRACVYDVYGKRRFSAREIADSGDALCIACMRCVQECKKGILSRVLNPQFARMGNRHFKPELIASVWRQAETGQIPVSGAGYRGPFTGPGFDQMWTDMSEIVRPTRDGIHGREYISTVIELGRRPAALTFDGSKRLLTEMPPFAEIPIPMILEIPRRRFVTAPVKLAIARAARNTQTLAIADAADAASLLAPLKSLLIVRFNPKTDDASDLKDIRFAELAFSDTVLEDAARLKKQYPELIVSIHLPFDSHAGHRAEALAKNGADILRFQVHDLGVGFQGLEEVFMTDLIKEVHLRLIDASVRDQLTVLFSGGIAMAEHTAKSVACGADGVVLDLALLASMECRLCPDCDDMSACPVSLDQVPEPWAAQRITNLVGAWHSQLIEVMGAMGLREVRRLRGEWGRVMFFDQLEKENLSPIFGERTILRKGSQKAVPALPGELEAARPRRQAVFPPLGDKVKTCPSRFRNALGHYKVVRTAACTACGKCETICRYGVHKKAGGRLLAPRSQFCIGKAACRSEGDCCVDHCPESVLRVGTDPMWGAFGDPRWPAEMLVATWFQAETGRPPEGHVNYVTGDSDGGFDRMQMAFPNQPPEPSFAPEDVDLRTRLNRSNDNRPEVTIGVPFYGGGMSYGSISLATMLARARAYREVGSFTCTGEGGFPEELRKYNDNVITQVATGLFGVGEDTVQQVRIVEFKYAQGAKPGLGGHLLGDKNTPAVSKMRETVPGYPLFSPFPFHSVYSVEDHKKHVDWIKEMNPRALVSVKVAGAADVDMVAVGSYFAGAHIVHLDGAYGGTGASPDIAKKNIAMPIEYAVPKVHRFLVDEGIRDNITLVGSGGIRSAFDVAKLMALGANGVVIGTAEVVALECVRCGVCESGRGCPRSIATTDDELAVYMDGDWAVQRLVNLFHSWAVQLQHICWRLGLRRIEELVGRSDLLIHLDYDNLPSSASETL